MFQLIACYPCKPQITDIYWRRILLFDTDLYSCIVFSIVLLHHLSILIMSVGRRRNSSWSTRLGWTDTDWITRREPAYGFVQTVVLPRLGITRIFLHCIIYLITSHRSMSCMVQFSSNPAGTILVDLGAVPLPKTPTLWSVVTVVLLYLEE